ncbi:MAG: hypothetical protein JNN26_19725 [Candidatus Obscuribacter sp.]|nr:hypothetical protein [Candidatus Obscuribacter sp.]
MKSRSYTELATPEIQNLLRSNWDTPSEPADFKKTMYKLGKALGEACSKKIKNSNSAKEICIACTVEDADFLAKGVLEYFTNARPEATVRFACFWNRKSIDPYGYEKYDIAPVIKEYVEPVQAECILIVVKTVISGGCVVATNITHLIENLRPLQIFIVAPLMLENSPRNLEKHFGRSITKRFQYLNFALDKERQSEGPSVYQRYGWEDEHDKNTATPEIVMERRKALALL